MKVCEKYPPRKYIVGKNRQISIKDCGSISLDPDEQVTFISSNNKEYDITRKNWGYYATPSVNGRLKNFGFKTALVKNDAGMLYVMLVDSDMINEFNKYLKEEQLKLLDWLDEN